MSKNELLKLLDDPEVVAKILALRRGTPAISPQGEKIALQLVNWWGKETGRVTIADLGIKIDVLEAIKRHGVGKVKEVLLKAIKSPLNEEGSFMKIHLSNIGWCVKPKNFDKIDAGAYSNKFSSKKSSGEALLDTPVNDLEGLER